MQILHARAMDPEEVERLRKAIYRSFASQPHKIKVWLALLEQYATSESKSGASKRPLSAGHRNASGAQLDLIAPSRQRVPAE